MSELSEVAPSDEPATSTPFRRAIAEYAQATSSKTDGGVRGRNLEVLLAPGDGTPRPECVVVFHHIRKTAGSSLRRVMFDNYPNTEKVLVGTPAFLPHHELKAWYEDFFASLLPSELDSIVAVASHTGNYLIHSLGRPV